MISHLRAADVVPRVSGDEESDRAWNSRLEAFIFLRSITFLARHTSLDTDPKAILLSAAVRARRYHRQIERQTGRERAKHVAMLEHKRFEIPRSAVDYVCHEINQEAL